jgi:protease I
MAGETLSGFTVALLATDGFEQSELIEPRSALREAGADTEVISLKGGKVTGWSKKEWANEVEVDQTLDEADHKDYDGLVLPGGVINSDALRVDPRAVAFVKAFVDAGKPIGVICHGAWTLIEAGGVRGRKLTSWPALKTDLLNAGAKWVDEEVVIDGQLVTSRKPDDLPAFNREITRLFGKAHSPLAHANGRRR